MGETQSSAAQAHADKIGGADHVASGEASPSLTQLVEPIEAAVSRLCEGLAGLSLTSRYSRDELDTIYALGWSHLSRGQADTGLRLFLFLTDYAPTEATYLMGLGVCLQQLDRPQDALAVFSWAGLLDAKNIEASLRSAESLLAMQRREEAEALLDLIVVDSMASSNKPTHIAYRAQALLDVLRRGIDASGAVAMRAGKGAGGLIDPRPISTPI